MHSLQGRQMRVRAAATVTAAVAAMEVVVPVVVRGRRMRPPVSFLLSRAGEPDHVLGRRSWVTERL